MERRSGGAGGLVLLTALEDLLHTIVKAPLRRISYHPPCRGMVTPDEMLMLGLVASAQAGDQTTATAIAGRLVCLVAETAVVYAAQEMGGAALAAGIILTPRTKGRMTPVMPLFQDRTADKTLH